MLAIHQSNRKSIIQQGKREKWTRDGNLLEGAEMLAIHQLNQKSNHSTREKGKMATRWKPPRRVRDPSFLSINQTKINHSWRKNRMMDAGQKTPRRRGDASYLWIKPEINHSSRKNGMMDAGWNSPRGGRFHLKINQAGNQSFINERWKMVAGWKPPRRMEDASNPSTRAGINQSSRKNEWWTQDGNLLEGEWMLAVHHQSNPKINHSLRKRGIMARRWKPPRRGGDA
jgi:hypothetical protein